MAVGEYTPASPSGASRCRAILSWLRQELLLVSTLSAVVLAVTLAIALRGVHVSTEVLLLIELPGQAFISLLRMLVLPVMLASVVTGSATLTTKTEGRLALVTLAYFLLSSLASALIGMILVLIIRPGNPALKEGLEDNFHILPGSEVYHTRLMDTILDMFRNAFPSNLVQACIQSEYTQYDEQVVNATGETTVRQMVSKRLGVNSLGNKLFKEEAFVLLLAKTIELYDGLIIFCMIFGISMASMGKQADLMKRFFITLDKLIMRLTLKVLCLMPIGVLSLICAKFVGAGDLVHLVSQTALFLLTVLLGLALQLFALQTSVYWAIVRKNPFSMLRQCLEGAITAFGVSSSSAAMPVVLQCLEERCGMDKRVTRFVIPVGVTINMNGTALFITVATLFIAQMNSVSVGIGGAVAVLITATLVSVSTASVPSASIFLMVVTLSVIGAPVEDVSLLFATEWILDRSRTVNNVLGDAFACGVVEHLCKNTLDHDDLPVEEVQEGEEIPLRELRESPSPPAPIASL